MRKKMGGGEKRVNETENRNFRQSRSLESVCQESHYVYYYYIIYELKDFFARKQFIQLVVICELIFPSFVLF